MKPGKTMLPVVARKRGSASSSAASAKLRVSFHRMQGRSTRSPPSISVAPCMWPDRPMPRTAPRSTPGIARRAAMACSHAAIQCEGSCSDQPGCRRETVSGALPWPTTVWSPSTRIAFTPDVPRSSPRYMAHPVVPLLKCPSKGPGGGTLSDFRAPKKGLPAGGPERNAGCGGRPGKKSRAAAGGAGAVHSATSAFRPAAVWLRSRSGPPRRDRNSACNDARTKDART